ncbi:MAG: YARHG domain-containing protein [Bacteroidales bacterium]|nr:YARHG domain-containing protein [Bacteroidales bacterium]
MKKLFFITATIILVAMEGRTQSVFPLDTVIHTALFEKTERLGDINMFDTLTIIESVSRHSSKTLVHGVRIDSCLNNGIPLGGVTLYADGMIYFDTRHTIDTVLASGKKTFKTYRGIAAYDPKLRMCKDIPIAYTLEYEKKVQVDLSRTQLYSRYFMSKSVLYIIDENMSKETMVADFRPYTDYKIKFSTDESRGSIEQVCAIGKSSYIVKTGIWEPSVGNTYTDIKYFKIVDGKIIDLTATVNQWVREQKVKLNVIDVQESYDEMSLTLLSSEASYMRGIVTYWGSGYDDKDRVHVSMIVNTDLQLVSPVLALKWTDERGGKNFTEVGINKQQGKIVNYFMRSNLNDEAQTKVIVPYVFSPQLDMLMYRAYHNEMIKKEDLQKFSKYELGILRNLIFAKYNYAFSSEFYQAYFNLYEFYGNEQAQKTRIKDVNAKLTETDKANINMIKEIEAKKQ